MSKRDELWAEHLLSRALVTTGPHPGDAARNLASIEARLGLASGSSPKEGPDGIDAAARSGAAAPTAARSALVPGRPRGLPDPKAPSGAALEPGTAWKGLGSPAKAGLVLSFGLVTGVIGYFIGRSDAEQHRAPIALDSPSITIPRVRPGPSGALTPSDASSGATPSADAAVPVTADIAQRAQALASRAIDNTRPAPTRARGVPSGRGERPGKRPAPSDTASLAPSAPARALHPSVTDADDRAFDLRDALELLRRAEGALRRSDGLEARMWLTDLDRRAPPGLLREERLVTQTLADCLLGNVREAQQTLHELELANAESMYRARLEGSCVSDRFRER
jgi:hypothetical protein